MSRARAWKIRELVLSNCCGRSVWMCACLVALRSELCFVLSFRFRDYISIYQYIIRSRRSIPDRVWIRNWFTQNKLRQITCLSRNEFVYHPKKRSARAAPQNRTQWGSARCYSRAPKSRDASELDGNFVSCSHSAAARRSHHDDDVTNIKFGGPATSDRGVSSKRSVEQRGIVSNVCLPRRLCALEMVVEPDRVKCLNRVLKSMI